MAVYPSMTEATPGTLLRLLQEEKGRMPHMIPPGAAPGAPMREMVTEPLEAVEAPGSARVISIRPEVIPAAPGEVPRVVAPAVRAEGAPVVPSRVIAPPRARIGPPIIGGPPAAAPIPPSPITREAQPSPVEVRGSAVPITTQPTWGGGEVQRQPSGLDRRIAETQRRIEEAARSVAEPYRGLVLGTQSWGEARRAIEEENRRVLARLKPTPTPTPGRTSGGGTPWWQQSPGMYLATRILPTLRRQF